MQYFPQVILKFIGKSLKIITFPNFFLFNKKSFAESGRAVRGGTKHGMIQRTTATRDNEYCSLLRSLVRFLAVSIFFNFLIFYGVSVFNFFLTSIILLRISLTIIIYSSHFPTSKFHANYPDYS